VLDPAQPLTAANPSRLTGGTLDPAGSAADDTNPEWSPDGRQIAFDSDRGGQRQLWVMDVTPEGLSSAPPYAPADLRPATAGELPSAEPTWFHFFAGDDTTSAAHQLAFSGPDPTGDADLHYVEQAYPGPAAPVSPFVLPPGTTTLTVGLEPPGPANDVNPAWSPQGSALAFASTGGPAAPSGTTTSTSSLPTRSRRPVSRARATTCTRPGSRCSCRPT
jgi:hypothetical protein